MNNKNILRTEDDSNWFIEYSLNDINDEANILAICKALGNEIRLDMYRKIVERPHRISELSKMYNLSNSSTIFHVNILKEANLIYVEYEPSKKGSVQVCYMAHLEKLSFSLVQEKIDNELKVYTIDMPVGNYVDIYADDRARYLVEDGIFKESPFLPEHVNALIVWVYKSGYITYAFPNEIMSLKNVEFVELSFEICSEAPYYQNDWKSGLDFYINDILLCSYLCKGDFGDRPGHISINDFKIGTKYGELVTIKISNKGIFLNEKLVNSNTTLGDLRLAEGKRFMFKITCPNEGEYVGGFNLFGDKYGDFAQGIRFCAIYRDK